MVDKFNGAVSARKRLNNGRRSQSVSTMPSSLTTENVPVHEPPIAHSEPGPSYWQEAKQLLGLSWEFHWAGFGFLFSVLAVNSVFVFAQIQARKGFERKPLVLGINILLAILGTTRALFLFVDPYSSGENGVEIPRCAGGLKPSLAPPQTFCQAFFIIRGPLCVSEFHLQRIETHPDGNVQKQLEDIEIGQSTLRRTEGKAEKEPRKWQKLRLQ